MNTASIDNESYHEHMAGIVAEGFTLDPKGYERLSAWTHVLAHLLHARVNFEWAANNLSQPGNMHNAVRQHAFFVAGIMAYCRCFVSTGSAIPKLDPKTVYTGSSDGIEVHERLMKLRNSFAAHSDLNDLVRVTLAVKADDDRVIVRHLITSAIPLPEISGFIEAVTHTEHFVTLSLNKQLEKMSAKIGKPVEVG